MRVFAAGAVVWAHTISDFNYQHIELRHVGYLGVPFFIFAAVFFSFQQINQSSRTLTFIIKLRVRRILIPYLVWASIYSLLTDLIFPVFLGVGESQFSWGNYLHSGAYHLWFLPFIFVVGSVSGIMAVAIRGRPRSAVATAVICLAAAVALQLLGRWSDEMVADNILLRWMNDSPVVFVAMAFFAIYWIQPQKNVASPLLFSTALIASLSILVFSIMAIDKSVRYWDHLAGLLLFLSALSIPSFLIPGWVVRFGALTYSVYIIHVMPVRLWKMILPELSHPEVIVFLAWVIITIASFVGVMLAKKVPGIRHLFP